MSVCARISGIQDKRPVFIKENVNFYCIWQPDQTLKAGYPPALLASWSISSLLCCHANDTQTSGSRCSPAGSRHKPTVYHVFISMSPLACVYKRSHVCASPLHCSNRRLEQNDSRRFQVERDEDAARGLKASGSV